MRTAEIKTMQDFPWLKRAHRDFVFLFRLARMTLYYWTKGRRIRRAYHRCQVRGAIYWVDEDPAVSERRIR